jgi:hypothetical protein
LHSKEVYLTACTNEVETNSDGFLVRRGFRKCFDEDKIRAQISIDLWFFNLLRPQFPRKMIQNNKKADSKQQKAELKQQEDSKKTQVFCSHNSIVENPQNISQDSQELITMLNLLLVIILIHWNFLQSLRITSLITLHKNSLNVTEKTTNRQPVRTSPNKTKLNEKGDRERLFILKRVKFTYWKNFQPKHAFKRRGSLGTERSFRRCFSGEGER